MEKIQSHLGYTNLITVEPSGLSGGLALFYPDEFNISLNYKDKNMIDIYLEINNTPSYITFLYGEPNPSKRENVWERLTRWGIIRDSPWLVIGDYNELSGNHEKQGGALRHANTFIAFNQMLTDCGLVDFPKLGNSWSWRGVRNNNIIRCMLDKAFGNGEWHDILPSSELEYLDMIGSDHRPILGRFSDQLIKQRKQFTFDRNWVKKTGYKEVIEKTWNGVNCRRHVSLVDMIKKCRRELSHWRSKSILPGRQNVLAMQKLVEDRKNDNTIDTQAIVEANSKLRQAYVDEEVYWKQKSRNKWLKEGDENTKFFHAQTKQRRAKNRIVGLFNKQEKWVTKEQDIIAEASSYFSNLFTSNGTTNFQLSEVEPKITDTDNQMLMRKATEEEIRNALFMMDPGKAPGPDGMTALFFQDSWSIIKEDLVKLVNEFLIKGEFEHGLNQTNICLIPKTSRPTRLTEFRPISLCNVAYKVISKVMCLRLKKVLPKLVSDTQSAFVAGRLISDNILIAQEMFHALRTNKAIKGKYMAIKTDMSKAYDRVEWSFVKALLLKLGFGEEWTRCIMFCITSVEYSILINGIPKGKICPQRGLRQGDPLSPYLFILCTEVLIAKMRDAENRKLITGLAIARTSPRISHLLFADDSLFFCKATKDDTLQILKILKEYGKISGQQINFEKSSIQFGHAVPECNKRELHHILGINKIGGVGTYLGLPEDISGAKTKVFAFVKEKLQNRINSWSSKLLSKAGKEILIKSVLTALPTYVMSCYRMPKSILIKLNSAIADFWWSTSETSKGVHWKKWKKLCKPKSEGGLGFRTLEEFNSALLAKQLWRILDFPDSLLAKVMKGKYFKDKCPLTIKVGGTPSYGWRSIMSARALVSKGIIRKIGDGKSIRVWKDPWIPDTKPRPAISPEFNLFPELTVDQFIDHSSGTWKEVLVRQYFNSDDTQIILGIPIPKRQRSDYWGWHLTNTGKYSVKSGYHIEEFCSRVDLGQIGPNFRELHKKAWSLNCPNKIRHFIWQTLSGCVAVRQNLNQRGINCDHRCSRCGADNESINHAIFECPPSLQIWALTSIPSAPDFFPGQSLWYNLDYLFWRIPNTEDNNIFPWIIWNIWKARNDHCFSNRIEDPRTILTQAALEQKEWSEARCEPRESAHSTIHSAVKKSSYAFPTISNHSFTGYKCFVGASWKATDHRTGLGWYCFPDKVGGELMGTRGVHRSLSILHSEVEGILWAMESLLTLQITDVELLTDNETMMLILNNPEEWPAFLPYQEEFFRLRALFSTLSLSIIPRGLNHKADALARFVRVHAHSV